MLLHPWMQVPTAKSPFSPAVGTFRFAHFSDPGRGSVILHCGFNLRFLDDAWSCAPFIYVY